MSRWQVVIACSVAALAAASMVAVPTASVASDAGRLVPIMDLGDDALSLEPGMRPLRKHPTARLSGAGAVYDLHVYAVSTPTRSMPLSSAQTQAYVQQLNAYYADQLGSLAPTFRVVSFTSVAGQVEDYCSLEAAESVIGRATLEGLTPTAGATDATWLIMTPDVSAGFDCDYAGMAWIEGRGAWLRHVASWVTSGWFVFTLVHEIGHNLGLTHSGKAYSRDGSNGWQGDGQDTFDPYGDSADPMGRAIYSASPGATTWTHTISHLHAHNRNRLGAMPASSIASVARGVTSTMSLAPLSSSSGTRVIYLPLFNRSKFFIEFRTSTGADALLDNRYGPGSGVYVRMVNTRYDEGPGDFDPGGDPYWPASSGSISWTPTTWEESAGTIFSLQGFRSGQTAVLPDGSTVTVGSVTSSSAQVTVSRPADTEPPSFDTTAYLDGCYSALDGTPCALRAVESTPGVLTADVTLPRVTDNQWVSSFTVAVDGAVVARRTSTPPGIIGKRDGLAEEQPAETVPLSLTSGSHVVTLTVTDSAGLTYSESTTVTVTLLRRAGAPTGLRHERRGSDDVIVYWTPPADTGGLAVVRYWIERSVSGGAWTEEGYIQPQYVSTLMADQPLDVPLRYRVAVETEAGMGAWGTSSEIILRSPQPPGPPQQVSLQAGNAQVTALWKAPVSDGGLPVTEYTAVASPGDRECTSRALTCTITGLTNGTPYTVSVIATNDRGDSVPAVSAASATPAGPPGKVVNVRGSLSGRVIRLTWSAPTDTGGAPVTQYRYRLGSGTWLTTTGTSVSIPAPRGGTWVTLSIQASNRVGWGPSYAQRLRIP